MSFVRSPRRARRPSTAVVTHIEPLQDHHDHREKKGTRRTIQDDNSGGQRNAIRLQIRNSPPQSAVEESPLGSRRVHALLHNQR